MDDRPLSVRLEGEGREMDGGDAPILYQLAYIPLGWGLTKGFRSDIIGCKEEGGENRKREVGRGAFL